MNNASHIQDLKIEYLLGITEISKKYPKMKHSTTIPENIIWLKDDIEISYKHSPEYTNNWQQHFGATPQCTIDYDGYRLNENRQEEYHKFLEDSGFIPTSQSNEYKTFINLDKKIIVGADENIKWTTDSDGECSSRTNGCIVVHFYPHERNKEFLENFIHLLLTEWITIPDKKNSFYMIAQNQNGLYNQETSFKAIPIKDDRFDLYYGDAFPHEKFVKFMDDDQTDSLLLFHGDPGSGKSNYLKNLISKSNRDVIYIPPSMVGVISEPSFITYMLSNRGALLLIEDAEAILGRDRNSGTNNLLNLCDGFLKDSMNLKVICTFNAPLQTIDPALLRKGRLYHSHEFCKLSVDESNRLAGFCNIGHVFKEESSLSDIFNVESETSSLLKEDAPIGFGNF